MTWTEYVKTNYSASANRVGVYGIYYKDIVLYIGQSANIYKRWLSHARHIDNVVLNLEDKERCAKYEYLAQLDNAKVEFKILAETTIEELNDIEIQAIEELKPLLNKTKSKYHRKVGK